MHEPRPGLPLVLAVSQRTVDNCGGRREVTGKDFTGRWRWMRSSLSVCQLRGDVTGGLHELVGTIRDNWSGGRECTRKVFTRRRWKISLPVCHSGGKVTGCIQ